MPVFNVSGMGAVRLPEGLSADDYERIVRRLQEKSGAAAEGTPDYSAGQTAAMALQRGLGGLGISTLYEFPALALTGVEKLTGSEAAGRGAESLLAKAKEATQYMGEVAPRRFQSYKEPEGVGQSMLYGLERFSEAVPSIGTSLIGGGIPALLSRGAAQRVGAAAAEKALASGAAKEVAQEAGQKAAERLLQRRAFAGSAGVMYPAQAAEPFVGIYERTGEREFAAPALSGAVSTLLEGIVPTSVLGNLGAYGKLKASERLLDKAGFGKAAADISLRAAGVGAAEGLTEAAQQAITNLAIQSADQTFNAFGPERTQEYIEAALSGFLGGAPIGAAGAAARRMRIPRDTSKEEAAVQRLQELAGVTPPETGVSQEVPAAQPLQEVAVMPVGQLTTATIPPRQEFEVAAVKPVEETPPAAPTETPVDQKYFEKFVSDIMAGVPRTTPEDQQFYANNAPAIEQRLREAAPASPAQAPAADVNIPVPPSETVQFAEPAAPQAVAEQVVEQGPPEFVEPPPMEGPAPLSEEDQRLADEIAELEKQADEIYTRMEAVQARERKRKSQGDTFLNALKRAGVSAKDVADIRKTQSDKNLDKAVVSGILDPWLGEYSSVAVDKADVFDQKMKQNEAVEYLKDRILSFDYVTDTTKAELADLDLKLADVLTMIREFRSELEANLEAAEAADEQRVVYEQVEQAVPKGEKRVTELGEATRTEREAAGTEVAYTPQSYAEQMMGGTLPDTDEAYAYFQENQQEIEQALADLEERRAQPMMKATADQSKLSQTHANDLGGVVVWQDGDLTLIRAHSRLTGDPLYVVANGSFRSRVDVESYTGNLINAPQKARLVAAKEALEKKDKALHDKSPFIKFDADGVVMSQSISPKLAGVIAGWKKLLKIPQGVYVTTMDDIVANRGKFTGPHRTIGSAALSDDLGSMRKMPDGNYYIAFTKDASVTRMLETLAHELGHIHERESFRNADLATQRSIQDEFDKFLNSSKGKSAKDYIESMRARGVGKGTKAGEKAKFEDLTPYWKSFGEWYADQVSRWATTSEKPLTVVERFFKRLADALKSFYAKVRNQKYLPNETFKQYMDKVTASVKDIAPVRVEAKPLGVKDQMALFMRAAMSQFDTPEFKRWFGDSKVVGPDGQPKVMYHGTSRSEGGDPFRKIDVYASNYGLMGMGGYFTDNPIVASEYTTKGRGETPTVYPVYLSIKNPMDMDGPANVEAWKKQFEGIENYHEGGNTNESWYRAAEEYMVDEQLPMYEGAEALQDAIRNMGFDGITHIGGGRRNKESVKHRVYIAFEPNQIKSVYNVGTFDPSTDEIQYMRRSVEGLTGAGKDLSPQEQPEKEEGFRLQMAEASDLLDGSPEDVDRGLRTMIESAPRIDQGITKVRQAVGDFTSDNSSMLLSFLNLRQLGKAAGNILPQMMDYYRKTSEMLTFRDNRLVRAAQLVERWDKWSNDNPADGKALSTVLLKARLTGLRPTRDEDLKKIADQEFLNAWNKIKGTEGAQIFKEIDRFFRTSAQLYFNALGKRIRNSIENKQARRLAFDLIKAEYNKFVQGGFYFPFARFGDYWVAYKYQNNTPAYYMFESQADQRNFIEQTVTPKLKANEIKDFKSGTKTSQMMGDGVAMSEFITKLMDLVDENVQMNMFGESANNATAKSQLKDDIWQLYLTMGPDLSVQKHFIHAKKVEGYSVDALRAFSESAFHGTYHLARITYGGDLDRIVLDARNLQNNEPSNERGRFVEELQRHHQDFSSPQGGNQYVSALTNFGFMFYLSAPASAIVNISQVPIVAAPYMAAFFKKSHLYALRQLGAAAKEFLASRKGTQFDLPAYLLAQSKNNELSSQERSKYKAEYEAINRLLGTLNRTQTLSLAGIAERPSALFATGIKGAMRTKALTKYQKVRIALGYMFNQAELFNRQVTALAAYRMALEAKNRDGTTKYDQSQAIEVARDIVDETHFEYAAETKARFMRGPVGQLVFQFMNYAQQMTALLATSLKNCFLNRNEMARLEAIANDKNKTEQERKEAREQIEDMKDIKREAIKRLSGIMFMTGTFAGYEGLPFFWAFEMVMNAMFGDDDEPYDFKLQAKQGLTELFGDNVARMFSTGVISEVTQMDWASRTSLNGLWFRENVTSKDEAEWLRNQLVDALGPAVGMFVGVAEGLKKINDGYTMRGIETMMPPILKDGFKSYRFATEGATTLRGDPIVADVGPYGILIQLLGFTPQEVARGQEARGEILNIVSQLDRKRSNLMNRLWIAHRTGDTSAYDDIGDEIIEFNSKNPTEEITDDTIRRSFAQRQRISDRAVQGLSLPERRQYLLEKIEYAGD